MMSQLKTAELKNWTAEEVKAALSMEIGSLGTHALDVLSGVSVVIFRTSGSARTSGLQVKPARNIEHVCPFL